MLISAFLIFALCITLVKSADWLISSSSRLAKHFGLSEFTVSFFVIAFATSLPEFTVGVVSALDNNPSLSLGNVVGSNIADLTLILALPILIGGGIYTSTLLKSKDLIYTVFLGITPFLLLMDGVLSRLDGLILISGYFFYLVLVLKKSSFMERLEEKILRTNVYKQFIILSVSTLLLLASSDLLVKEAESLSIKLNIPLIFIGITITAIGTSLPELAFGLKAIKSAHKSEVLGNVAGSVIANSTIVLGTTALLTPIRQENISNASFLSFFVILAIFSVFSVTNKRIDRLEAFILLVIYIIFVLVEKTVAGI
ncbi:MAG: sodium:calcium antiporter [Patescibacteria group bacterium]